MSSSIWTRCAGDSEIRALDVRPYRAVESQHQVSTRKLVDTLEEQRVLEELIDSVKPPDTTRGRQHYLLSTPFRYPPLRHGSRFGARTESGIWYGSESYRALFAEVAYYRLVFLDGTRADLGTLHAGLTVFRGRARTKRGVDLAAPAFAAHRRAIASPSQYDRTQALGRAMREAGVEVFRYPSARDRDGGTNIGIFTPAAFGSSRPAAFEDWHAVATRARVEFAKRDYFAKPTFAFERDEFLVSGALPLPAL